MASGSGDYHDVPDLISDEDFESDEDEWDDDEHEEKINMLTGDVNGLFTDHVFPSVEHLLSHCKESLKFDLVSECRKWNVDSIAYIQMINFIRKQRPSPEEVKQALMAGGSVWAFDEYMAATDPSDLMLQFDIESAVNSCADSKTLEVERKQKIHDYTESEAISALVQRIQRAEQERDLLREELGRALKDIDRLKLSGQQLVLGSSTENSKGKEPVGPNDLSLHEEDGYFASYSHHDIHMTMLKDKVRTESYRDFMFQNPHLFEGKAVLDVGCGTGILSMFAVKAGARQVVAVDMSNIIYQAMDIARENNMHEKITFVKGRLEDVTLPIEQFDVIISEWMGYFLLFEAMLDSVIWARDHYLAPGGCVYPDHFSLLLVGVSDLDLRKAKLDFWDDVYGFKMSCMKSSVIDEVHVRQINSETIVTEPVVLREIDVMTSRVGDLDFITEFSLKCSRDAEMTAVVGYFNTDFASGCYEKVSFSTGPHATPTHWEQAVMMLRTPLQVKQGCSVEGKITYRKHPHDARGIIITLTIGKQKLKYSLS